MATSLSNRNADRMYKYESIRVELIKYFEGNYFFAAETVKDYFYNFHRRHTRFQFFITTIRRDNTRTGGWQWIHCNQRRTGKKDWVFHPGKGLSPWSPLEGAVGKSVSFSSSLQRLLQQAKNGQ